MKKVQDHYFKLAKRQGFAARSAFKLQEIARKHRLLRPGLRVLDLGSAPGSWLQVVAAVVGPGGAVMGVDLQPLQMALPAQVRVLQADVMELDPAGLLAGSGGTPFDLLLSDMAPNTTGIRSVDADRSAALAGRALDLACAVLKPGGAAVVKVFQGGNLPALRKRFAAEFGRVRIEKPAASRSESVEVFLVGLDKGPASPSPDSATPKASPSE